MMRMIVRSCCEIHQIATLIFLVIRFLRSCIWKAHYSILFFFVVVAMEDQSRMTSEFEDKRRHAEETQLRLQQEHERRMEQMNYEQEEKDKIVGDIRFLRIYSMKLKDTSFEMIFLSAIMAIE